MSTILNGQNEFNEYCPECNSNNIIMDDRVGERVCPQCGYVLGNTFLDRKPEWRAFNFQEKIKRSRVGLPTSLAVSDKGLKTIIGNIYRDTKGNISIKRKHQLLRISKWQNRIHGSSKQRNLNKALSILANLVSHLKIRRNVQEEAALLYRKALQKDLIKGRCIENIIAACLYAACRFTNTQRNLDEIAEYISADKRDLARAYRFLYKELNLNVPRPNARNKIPKIASRTNISLQTQNHAIEILRSAEKEKITAGKDPNGLAAAALYIACLQDDFKITQKEIAYAAGVTEVTIRNRYRGIVNDLDISL